MVTKIIQVESERAVSIEAHHASHLRQVAWSTIRGEPHDLVFVTVMRKAEILREGLIENAQRMREQHAPFDAQGIVATDAPSSAGKITESIHGYGYRFAIGRDKKARSQVRQVVLDPVQLRTQVAIGIEALELRLYREAPPLIAQPIENQPRRGTVQKRIAQAPQQVRLRVAVDGDVVDITQADPAFRQAVADGLRGKASPMLDPSKSFLLSGGDNFAIIDEAGGSVAVVGVEPEDQH